MMKLITKMKTEKLNIHIEYDEEVGLSLKEFNDYLNGLNESYGDFTNKKSQLNIKSISSGSVYIEFVQYVLVPVLTSVISNGVYDFGKSLIESVKYIQKDYDKALTEIKEKKQETITKAKKTLSVIGIGNTINSINIEISAGNGEQENFAIDQDFMKTTNQGIKSAIEGVYEEIKINKRREELFESVELKFKTVSEPNTDGTYSGWIEDIHKDAKKVTFSHENIKNTFPFDEFSFEKKYLVSITVYYNGNGSIAKYEITENMGEI